MCFNDKFSGLLVLCVSFVIFVTWEKRQHKQKLKEDCYEYPLSNTRSKFDLLLGETHVSFIL